MAKTVMLAMEVYQQARLEMQKLQRHVSKETKEHSVEFHSVPEDSALLKSETIVEEGEEDVSKDACLSVPSQELSSKKLPGSLEFTPEQKYGANLKGEEVPRELLYESRQKAKKLRNRPAVPRPLNFTYNLRQKSMSRSSNQAYSNILIISKKVKLNCEGDSTPKDYVYECKQLRKKKKKKKRKKRSRLKYAEDLNSEMSSEPKDVTHGKKKKRIKKKKKVACEVCGKLYDSFYLKVHMRFHTGEKPFTCAECNQTFPTRNQHKIHFQRHHGNAEELQCDICHRTLASKASLKEHKRTHSNEKPYHCQICDKSFKQSSMLINHVKTHSDYLTYQCEQCGKRYKTKKGMERHRESIHEGIRRLYPCEVCGRMFCDISKLKDHSYGHQGNSPYICGYCGRKFLSRKILQLHVLIHEDKKPFQCEFCGKAFRQRCVLKRHLSVHTGIKPFRCDVCSKQFIHRVYLLRHKCSKMKTSLADMGTGEEDDLADTSVLMKNLTHNTALQRPSWV